MICDLCLRHQTNQRRENFTTLTLVRTKSVNMGSLSTMSVNAIISCTMRTVRRNGRMPFSSHQTLTLMPLLQQSAIRFDGDSFSQCSHSDNPPTALTVTGISVSFGVFKMPEDKAPVRMQQTGQGNYDVKF